MSAMLSHKCLKNPNGIHIQRVIKISNENKRTFFFFWLLHMYHLLYI